MLLSLECEISWICEKLAILQTDNWAGIHPKINQPFSWEYSIATNRIPLNCCTPPRTMKP